MLKDNVIRIDLDKVLLTLFYVYAFSLPFELILEILFEVETIFKPFRVFSLLIIGVFGIRVLKNGLYINPDERSDIFLYLVFVYGILISFFKIITGVFNYGLFYNDLFQFGLHVATFFIFKTLVISNRQMMILFRCFMIGLIINSIYIFVEFVLLSHYGRQSGFTDNPNYGALGLVAVITYLLLSLNYLDSFWKRFSLSLLVLFLIYIFIIEGSRTGLVMFVVANFFLFFFYSIRRKIALLAFVGLVVLLLLPQQLEKLKLGGGPLILISRVNNSLNTEEEDVRFIVWRGVFRILEIEGYEGLGIGQFKANFPKYFSEESHSLILEMVNRTYFLSTHNDYLAILTDYGLFSLLMYLVFLFLMVKKTFRRLVYPEEDEDARFLAQYGFIMLVCLIIFGMAAENFQHQLFWFLLMFSTKS